MSFFRNIANTMANLKTYRDISNVGNPNYDPLGGDFNCMTNPTLRPAFDPIPSIFGNRCGCNPFMNNGFNTPMFGPITQFPSMTQLPQMPPILTGTINNNNVPNFNMGMPGQMNSLSFDNFDIGNSSPTDFGLGGIPSLEEYMGTSSYNTHTTDNTNININYNGDTLAFIDALAGQESGGKYTEVNDWGYAGKYQMGEGALNSAGYYVEPKSELSKKGYNDWKGQWTGKDGVNSLNDYLHNKQAQEKSFILYKKNQWTSLKRIGATKYIGQTINGVKITEAALLGGSHLGGPGGVMDFLKSNGKDDYDDQLGTRISTYMKKFGGYDVSQITGTRAARLDYAS